MSIPYLKPTLIKSFIRAALKEDIGPGDYSSMGSVPENATRQAQLLIKDDGMIAGIEMAKYIFAQVDKKLELELFKKDGDLVEKGEIGFVIAGSAQSILSAERLVLNCLQRMSGIAT